MSWIGTLDAVTTAEISVQELAALGATARIVDVREPGEWVQGHIGHASLVPLATVPGNLDAFDGEPTYVVCRSGGRSGQACDFLRSQGLSVVNVTGGMIAWTAAGLDVVTGDAGTGATGG
jgi:rhodanese-related sulfurtransferase